MQKWKATHEITHTNHRGVVTKTRVMLCDGSMYTKAEWDSCEGADWTYSKEEGLLFQGRTTPGANDEVVFRKL